MVPGTATPQRNSEDHFGWNLVLAVLCSVFLEGNPDSKELMPVSDLDFWRSRRKDFEPDCKGQGNDAPVY